MTDDMSLQMVQSEKIFYARVKRYCDRMLNILNFRKPSSVFVTSIYKFCDEFEDHHNSREQFIQQCKILENARQGYIKNELTEEEECGREFPNGNVQIVFITQILEDLCVCIEKYLEQKLFGVWLYTDKNKEAPEYPAARQSMKNLTSLLRECAGNNQEVLESIGHLQENFDFVITKLVGPVAKKRKNQDGEQQAQFADVDSLLQSLAQLSDLV
jgi:hypothetical protein